MSAGDGDPVLWRNVDPRDAQVHAAHWVHERAIWVAAHEAQDERTRRRRRRRSPPLTPRKGSDDLPSEQPGQRGGIERWRHMDDRANAQDELDRRGCDGLRGACGGTSTCTGRKVTDARAGRVSVALAAAPRRLRHQLRRLRERA